MTEYRPAELRHHGDAELLGESGELRDFAVNVCADPQPGWLATAIATACGQLARYPGRKRRRRRRPPGTTGRPTRYC